jgi:hypothetical protein
VVLHETSHPPVPGEHIQETFRALVENDSRTIWICADIAASAKDGRNSLVLTRWTDHLEGIEAQLAERDFSTRPKAGPFWPTMATNLSHVAFEQTGQSFTTW